MTGSRAGNRRRADRQADRLIASSESAVQELDAHARAHREAARVARLLPGLTDEEAHFAVHLKPVHEQVKLATLGSGGAIILFVGARIPATDFHARLSQ